MHKLSRRAPLTLASARKSKLVLTRDTRARSLHQLQDFLQGRHGRVTWRRHRESSVGSAAFNRPLGILPFQKSVNQSRSEGIAATDAVKNFQVLAVTRFIKTSSAITNGIPIINGRCLGLAQSGSHNAEGEIFHHLFNHALESVHMEIGKAFIHSRNFITKLGRKSSSLPRTTSTNGAMRRLTNCACF